MDQNKELYKAFLASETPEDFFKKSLPIFKEKKNFSFSEVARRAGYSSRSYVRSIFLGIRACNASVVEKFSGALKLPKKIETGLLLMIKVSESRTPSEKAKLSKSLETIKKQIRKHVNQKRVTTPSKIFNLYSWPYVFAALGTDDPDGVSLKMVSKKTSLPESECEKVLSMMIQKNLVSYDFDNQKYKAEVDMLNFNSLGHDEAYFEFYRKTLKQITSEMHTTFQKKDSLFYCSVFSIKKKDIPEAREKVRALLEQFSCGVEDPVGEKVVTLQTYFR